jgi:GNAT superfamily N-acetyltransferase
VSTPSVYRFERLGEHNRASFSCGVPELDHYLHNQAGQDLRRNVAAPFVMLDALGMIVGYYTLSSYAVRLPELPPVVARKFPRYPLLPATPLGRLAVSRDHQGRQLGRALLMNALFRSWKNTSEIASVGVVVEAYDDAARAFYLHHEFLAVPEHPTKLFLPMRTIQKAFA